MDIETLRDIDNENYVLSALMTTEGYLRANEFKLTTEDFYNSKNKTIFKTIKEIFDKEQKIDLILLIEKLKSNGDIKNIGASYLTELNEVCYTLETLESHIMKLKEYSHKRKLYDLSKFIQSNLDKSAEELQSASSQLLLNTLEEEETIENSKSQGEKFLDYLEEVEKGNIKQVKTYISDLDRIIGGIAEGNLATVFAFSNVGKTTFALQVALNNIRMKKKVLYFSLEMSSNELRGRLITNLIGIDYQKLMYKGNKTPEEFEKILSANDDISKGLLVSNEDNLSNIVAKIQYEVLKNNIDLIIIDYIDLITLTNMKKEEYQKNIEVTRTLKRLALKLKKPIMILAQGKQEMASKMNNQALSIHEKVSVNDVFGGSSIFKDSDIVIGLYRNTELDNKQVREELGDKIDYNSKNPEKNPESIAILVKKTRASGKGIISCIYKGNRFRIANWN